MCIHESAAQRKQTENTHIRKKKRKTPHGRSEHGPMELPKHAVPADFGLSVLQEAVNAACLVICIT
jgi:hypothetical protein